MTDAAAPRGSAPTGAASTRRDLLFGGLLAGAAALAWARTPRTPDRKIGRSELDKLIPLALGPWRFETASGLILPPPDELAKSLYDQELARTYVAPAEALLPPVMLMIAYGSTQSGMLQLHRPEVCYPASGFRLAPTVPVDVRAGGRDIPAQYFTADRELRSEKVLYWTRIGDMIPRSWSEQRLAVVESNLEGLIPDGVLVRLSTMDGDAASAQRMLTRFADLLIGQAGARGRSLLVGDGSRG